MNEHCSLTLLFAFIGTLFIVIGLPLAFEKIGPNSVYGFRTAKTMSDPRVWYSVNRIGGIDFCISGTIILISSFVLKWLLSDYSPQLLLGADWAIVLITLCWIVIHFILV